VKLIRGSFTLEDVKKMQEYQSLLWLPTHANVVSLYEVHHEYNSLVYFVFEYMPTGSLHDVMEQRYRQRLGPLPDDKVRNLLRQLLAGVAHLHDHGLVHRDLKPKNVLLHGDVCKVADFSQARACVSHNDGNGNGECRPMTTRVSTLWYRAPEILLASPTYSSPVDLWAVGCMGAELYKLAPLFPGRDEVDQLRLYFSSLGTPEQVGWTEGANLLETFPCVVQSWSRPVHSPKKILRKWLRGGNINSNSNSNEATPAHNKDHHAVANDDTVLDFLLQLLHLDPKQRINAVSALQHDFFSDIVS
jgi:male germ cell-associated kinase